MNKYVKSTIAVLSLMAIAVGASAKPTVSLNHTYASKGVIDARATEGTLTLNPIQRYPRVQVEGRVHRDRVTVNLPAPFPKVRREDNYGTAGLGYKFYPVKGKAVTLTPSVYGLASHEGKATAGARLKLNIPVTARTSVAVSGDVRNNSGRKEAKLLVQHRLTKHIAVQAGATAWKQSGVKAAGGTIGIEVK